MALALRQMLYFSKLTVSIVMAGRRGDGRAARRTSSQ